MNTHEFHGVKTMHAALLCVYFALFGKHIYRKMGNYIQKLVLVLAEKKIQCTDCFNQNPCRLQ